MSPDTDPSHARKLTAILFADIAGYGRLVDRDEERNLERINSAIRLLRKLIEDYEGHVSNVSGDGILAVFDSATKAVKFAIAFQSEIKNDAVWNGGEDQVAFRIGIHLGEMAATEHGPYGHSVNVAARLQALAEPGGICVSDLTKMAVHDWSDIVLRPMGKQYLKNISEPVEAHSLEIVHKIKKPKKPVRRKTKPVFETPDTSEKEASVAVLVFENQTGDAADNHFCDGLTDDIISGLCRFRDLLVIARRSTEPYRDRATPPDAIGRELGVRYLLDGGLQRSGPRLRVRVRSPENNRCLESTECS